VLAVGADFEDSAETGTSGIGASNAANGSGAAYVFRRTGTSWSPEAYIKASNTGVDDGFGFALALSGDGAVLVVGAPGEDSGATTIDGTQTDESVMTGGAAYSFTKTSGWLQTAYLKPSNIDFGDFFGRVITMSSDGSKLAIASPGEDMIQPNSGAVFTFARAGASWTALAKLKAFTPGDNAQFGSALALTATGGQLYSGAPFDDDGGSDAGAVYQHVHVTSWSEGILGKAAKPGPGDNFGYSIATSADGRTVAAGAPYEDSNANTIDGDATNDDGMDNGSVEIGFY
jgi:hypothetical protein